MVLNILRSTFKSAWILTMGIVADEGSNLQPFSHQPRSALLLFLSLSPIAPLHSSQVFSLSGGVGRPLWQSLLARRASGAVVALAASSLWGVAPEHQTQVPAGHQTHPSTKRGFLGSLVFPLCVFVCVRAPVRVCICCVFGHTVFSTSVCNTLDAYPDGLTFHLRTAAFPPLTGESTLFPVTLLHYSCWHKLRSLALNEALINETHSERKWSWLRMRNSAAVSVVVFNPVTWLQSKHQGSD